MVDPRLVERKLATIAELIARARSLRQEALDLAAHIIADGGWDVPATAREHFELLASHQVISTELAEELARCAGARNSSPMPVAGSTCAGSTKKRRWPWQRSSGSWRRWPVADAPRCGSDEHVTLS